MRKGAGGLIAGSLNNKPRNRQKSAGNLNAAGHRSWSVKSWSEELSAAIYRHEFDIGGMCVIRDRLRVIA